MLVGLCWINVFAIMLTMENVRWRCVIFIMQFFYSPSQPECGICLLVLYLILCLFETTDTSGIMQYSYTSTHTHIHISGPSAAVFQPYLSRPFAHSSSSRTDSPLHTTAVFSLSVSVCCTNEITLFPL